ncbi:hypothetical protein S7711_11100 [Stachybotrys chartarum IBT 7711]|uniref:Uncharacterized protein n=1 Tax=Stachybotrys chartarum (strain CBS 109288 / IBT 7711) TaxID=1280523 RepID=A0A084AYB9_STACB|nr:hypothetical protein S7711_11100 [Stachybotrys chartarum IBT 7711]
MTSPWFLSLTLGQILYAMVYLADLVDGLYIGAGNDSLAIGSTQQSRMIRMGGPNTTVALADGPTASVPSAIKCSPCADERIVIVNESSTFSGILRKRFPNPTSSLRPINIVNATPYRWRKGFQHTYQTLHWEWPDYIEPGQTVCVVPDPKHTELFVVFWYIQWKDSAAEVAYHLEGTTKPMSFMIQYKSGKKHPVWVQFLEDLSTRYNRKGYHFNLQARPEMGGMGFVIAGKEGDFISNDGPLAWMQREIKNIGHLTLRELVMPRSHSSGTHKMVRGWKAIKLRFRPPQVRGIYEQMADGGVRVLDVRPVCRQGNVFHAAHGHRIEGAAAMAVHEGSRTIKPWRGMYGDTLQKMVDDINRFNEKHPGELVILDVHPIYALTTDEWSWYLPMISHHRDMLYNLVLKQLNHRLSVPEDEDLTKWPLERFIGNKTSAVLIRFHEIFMSKDAFWPGSKEGFITNKQFPVSHRASDSPAVHKVVADQLEHLHRMKPNREAPLFSSDWVLKPPGPYESIVVRGTDLWRALYDEMWNNVNDEVFPNWISMDNIHGNEGKAIMMAMNHCLGARRCGSLGGKVKGVVKLEGAVNATDPKPNNGTGSL